MLVAFFDPFPILLDEGPAARSLNTARWHHTATLLCSGKVLVVGGATGSTRLASAELYDPAADSREIFIVISD